MIKNINRIIFIGTPEFAVPSLISLINYKRPILVITQPDKPKGRGQKLSSSPVKKIAKEYELTVFQPNNINNPESLDTIRATNPDIIITVAFGKIMKSKLLRIPKYGCINLHPSLLPKYRGPAPINWAIFNNDKITGNTIYFMNNKMDAGDIIYQNKTKISKDGNYLTLSNKLSKQGAKDIISALKLIENDKYNLITQNNEEASYSHFITTKIRAIKWENPAIDIYNKIRGLSPKPSSFMRLKDRRINVISAKIGSLNNCLKSGEIINIHKDKGIEVACGDGSIILEKLQPSGKRVMPAIDFYNGANIQIGDYFLNG